MSELSPPREQVGTTDAAGYAATLRDATKDVHRQAERTGFIAALIRGKATREGYATFLRNLVPAYAVLEAALLAHVDDPLMAAFADPRLRRLGALTADLEALAGPDWAAHCVLVPEAEAYAAAIETAARGDGRRLIAHAYARYLGDLSGGQILKPLLARMFGLGPEALAFYDFPDVADLAEPKIGMRQALDRVPTDGLVADEITSEAIEAFRHNIAVSEAVQATLT
jgi:heme oxygenase